MADGSYKAIEDVKIGDIVRSYDEVGDSVVSARVVDVYHHSRDEMLDDYYLVINDRIRVTPNHCFYVNNNCVQAYFIRVGDMLLNENGEYEPVYSIEKVPSRVASYNLEVETFHNYFAEGVLVHNDRKGEPPCFLAGTRVLMANSSYKNIEDIRVGDVVKVFNEDT
ncbi:MAG: hypothetical protein FE038_01845 [Thermoplasmata archaeon]|nr:MAG: hypothetical protein FE038_01845 [Thermoplasmata archaeon]